MITVTFLNGCILATAEQSLWQYSYNQQLEIIGLELPEVFTVDFCNTGSTSTVAMIGSNNVVDIPNELLMSGNDITAYVFQKSALTGGITRCEIRIDVLPRPERDDETPTPEQEAVIDQLIEELNEGVDAADESAEDAEAWAVGERGGVPVEKGDPTYENNAKYYAGLASASEIAAGEAADAAAHSVTDAAGYAQEASDYASAADQSARDASGYASDAETQAGIATDKAEESAGHAQEAESYSEDSEAWAIGKRGGTDVPQDDPAYNNNALFYARAAEDGAKTSGYAWFDVDNEDGLLYVTFTSNQDTDVNFALDTNTGELEVVFT